jgi:hypothetical protein
MAASGNSFAATSAHGDCTRCGISNEVNSRIQSEGARGRAVMNCFVAGGNYRDDIDRCMPNDQYTCERQGLIWKSQYNECFPR